MKLYTEEQVKESFKSGFRLAMETDGGLKEGQEEIFNSLTPIELQSDEYIDEVFQPMTELHQYYKDGFINGAKWMKEQILNQNK